MNICLLTIDLSTVGGINKVTFDLAKDLLDCCNNVTICGIINGTKKPFYNNSVESINLFDENLRMKEYIFNGSKKLIEVLKRKDIDVVLLQGEAAGLLGAFTRLSYKKCKYVYCDHGALTYDINGLSKLMTNITLWICGHFTDASIFETEQGQKDFYQLISGNINKYYYIYNYGNDNIAITNLSVSKKLLTVGRMTSQKGFDYAIEVASLLDKDIDWEWDFIGDGEEKTSIQNKINEYHLDDRIKLLGSVKELDDKYKDYYLMVCTSRHEGLPMALIDAKFAKLPIISFNIKTGPSEIIIDNVNGNLIDAFDCNKMAETINTILKDDNIRKKYVSHAWDNKEKFSRNSVLDRWKNVLWEIIK